jgi:hypothetical protein
MMEDGGWDIAGRGCKCGCVIENEVEASLELSAFSRSSPKEATAISLGIFSTALAIQLLKHN